MNFPKQMTRTCAGSYKWTLVTALCAVPGMRVRVREGGGACLHDDDDTWHGLHIATAPPNAYANKEHKCDSATVNYGPDQNGCTVRPASCPTDSVGSWDKVAEAWNAKLTSDAKSIAETKNVKMYILPSHSPLFYDIAVEHKTIFSVTCPSKRIIPDTSRESIKLRVPCWRTTPSIPLHLLRTPHLS
jgi:hypothetical protein